MSSTLYGLYEQSTLALAGTLVINHTMIGVAMNNALIASEYAVDQNDKTSWRYYLNMAGEYTQADHDYCSTINSDGSPYVYIAIAGPTGPFQTPLTYDLINGTNADPAIAGAYRYGTRAYETLLEQYPRVELLIRGILNPIPIEISTSAEDGAILHLGGYYRSFLNSNPATPVFILGNSEVDKKSTFLESNEVNIIPKLELWVKNIFKRWYNPDFSTFNSYYLALTLGTVYAQTVSQIMNLRLANYRTAEVNSYFIQEAFASAGLPPSWALALNKPEAIYVYRNLDYFIDLNGQQVVFDDIVKNVLQPSSIPLAGIMGHQSTGDFTSDLRPIPALLKQPITNHVAGDALALTTVTDVIHRESTLAPFNTYDQEGQISRIAHDIAVSADSNLMTQVVTSDILQLGDAAPIGFGEFLIYMWMLYASTGTYTGLIYIADPVSGNDIALTPLSALLLATYSFNVGFGQTVPVDMPSFPIRFTPISTTHVPTGFPDIPTAQALYTEFGGEFTMDEVNAFIGTVSPIGQYGSVESFFVDAQKQYHELARRYRVYTNTSNSYRRAYGQNLVSKLYWTNQTVTQSLVQTDYVTFLTNIGINLTGLSKAGHRDLFATLVTQATGNTVNAFQSLENLQEAAIGVLKAFSSFTVQYLTSITGQDLISCNNHLPRTWVRSLDAKILLHPYLVSPITSITSVSDSFTNSDVNYQIPGTSIDLDNNAGVRSDAAEFSSPVTTIKTTSVTLQPRLSSLNVTATFT